MSQRVGLALGPPRRSGAVGPLWCMLSGSIEALVRHRIAPLRYYPMVPTSQHRRPSRYESASGRGAPIRRGPMGIVL
jgi:hypothetical protein